MVYYTRLIQLERGLHATSGLQDAKWLAK